MKCQILFFFFFLNKKSKQMRQRILVLPVEAEAIQGSDFASVRQHMRQPEHKTVCMC